MVQNPPEGTPQVAPYLLYEDAAAALTWLADAFGFVEIERLDGPDGAVSHAGMNIGEGRITLGSPGPDYGNPKTPWWRHAKHLTSTLMASKNTMRELRLLARSSIKNLKSSSTATSGMERQTQRATFGTLQSMYVTFRLRKCKQPLTHGSVASVLVTGV